MKQVAPLFAILACSSVLGSCGPPQDLEHFVDDKAPAARAVGEPVSCIPSSRLRDSKVHSDYTIDFETSGGQIYRTTIPGGCPGLGFEERFAYSTSISQLCSSEIITVLDSNGMARGSCGLGQFVPIKPLEN